MSEFRQDIVSGDWVIIAPGRSGRPHSFKEKRIRKPAPKSTCPFENLRESGNWPPRELLPSDEKKWRIALIPNKYPALTHDGPVCSVEFTEGIYTAKTGVGWHDIVVTRDHNKNFAEIDLPLAVEIFSLFQKYHREAAEDKCHQYVVPFFNWGAAAGASLWHPHYQMLALPAVPARVVHSLAGAKRYFENNHRCVRCDVIRFERRAKERVIEENKHAIAIAPYASKFSYELRIFPKIHAPSFRNESAAVVRDVVMLLRSVMKRMKKYLNDPDLNFFIHDAPLKNGNYPYHHWHAEISPRISPAAGFEASTGMYINGVAPETATAILRGRKI